MRDISENPEQDFLFGVEFCTLRFAFCTYLTGEILNVYVYSLFGFN